MLISNIRFCLLQLRVQNVYSNHSLRKRVLYRSIQSQANPKIVALRDKLLYCDYLDHELLRVAHKRMKDIQEQNFQEKIRYFKLAYVPAVSVFASDMYKEKVEEVPTVEEREDAMIFEENKQKPVYMPYSRIDSYEAVDTQVDAPITSTSSLLNEKYKSLYEKYLEVKKNVGQSGKKINFEEYMKKNSNNALPKGELWKVPSNWLTDFEQYDDTLLDEEPYNIYGTSDPTSQVSSIPCGGCGALLHCKDPAIPGYLPSELMLNKSNDDLKLMICQRCHFLKFYNAALEVKVLAEDYPKLLSIIKKKKCAVILMVDLTDFPCSIWPDLKSIMHPFTPVFLVGNKIDLLPRDCATFYDNVKDQLVEAVLNRTGIKNENITHVALTSAKTGYGIEELINKLQHKWRNRGDVYLIGCTNVGKSSLFNALLNSDYCKVQAVDLVQRATISVWPGTTLNLLKFPILNPTTKKLVTRMQRLKEEQKYKSLDLMYNEAKFRVSKNMKYATLQGRIGRSFTGLALEDERSDPFTEQSHKIATRKFGLDESRPEYEQSRWCYDTPGTIQTDQILDLLTTDELLLTLPQEIISPRTFIMRANQTLFVAGMGRLDYVEGEYFIRCTLFTSQELPITICRTTDADYVYNQLLETEAFVVPVPDVERLKVWPKLESEVFKTTGICDSQSAADVILSSIGWVAITPQENENVTLRAWTPQGRGIHFRTPALLKNSVSLRGKKIPGTPMYTLGRKIYVK